MRFALLQPNWAFPGSSYFGCQETHFPFELLFARQQLERAGHECLLVDGHLEGLTADEAAGRVRDFDADFTVVTTAPTYLFWRCPQPELRVPAAWMRTLKTRAIRVAVGPHGSATPGAALAKLGCEVALRGEPEQVLPRLAGGSWAEIEGCCWREAAPAERAETGAGGGARHLDGRAAQADMTRLGALGFGGPEGAARDYPTRLRRHRHHVFTGEGRGAELEFSRGCPWSCDFCNKTLFRNQFRQRRVGDVLAEAEGLARLGFDYVYFIDEIFGCGRRRDVDELLDGLAQLPLTIGAQTRIDLWDEDSLARLARAHCVSLECGIESITAAGRDAWNKGCRLDTTRIMELLRRARSLIPWVQANLIAADEEDLAAVEAWRRTLIADGVWVSRPVPAYPFPGSPLYAKLFGPPDDAAWERAHAWYLRLNDERGYYSDVQAPRPEALASLEAETPAPRAA